MSEPTVAGLSAEIGRLRAALSAAQLAHELSAMDAEMLRDEVSRMRNQPVVVLGKPDDPRSLALARALAFDRPLDGYARRAV